MIVAAFFDPASDGFDVLDSVAVLTAVGLLYAGWRKAGKPALRRLVAWCSARATRWVQAAVEEMVDRKLAHWTAPIQKGANGGKSLPDANRKLDLLLAHMGLELGGDEA